jgi:DNA-binding LacI/PurR family transcriptional regulator
VLQSLLETPTSWKHGYELSQLTDLKSGTLYPLLMRLSEQGFLEARGSAGTFLVEHPPDRACIALIFPEGPDSSGWNRFFSSLQAQSTRWRDGLGWRFEICIAHPGGEAHRRLCDRVADGALAGLLFACIPHQLIGSPLLTAGIPRVAIGAQPPEREAVRFASTIIRLQSGGLFEAICARFAASGRRRLAVISILHPVTEALAGMTIARRAGLATRVEWWLGLAHAPAAVPAARSVAHLLCTGRHEDRPDCLVVSDDNLVHAAIAGVLDDGLRVPEDIAIVAHANFPDAAPTGVSCRRYGYDSQRILAMALAEIARLRAGSPRRTVEAPVSFAEEGAG